MRPHAIVKFATEYADQSDEQTDEQQTEEAASDEFVIPEDLTTVADEDLVSLHQTAIENFDSMYGDGTGLTDQDFETLRQLTEGIESLSSELNRREEAEVQRQSEAAELATRVRPASEGEGESDSEQDAAETEDYSSDADEPEDTSAPAEQEQPEPVAASAQQQRSPVRVSMSTVRNRAQRSATSAPRANGPAEVPENPTKVEDVMFAAGDGLGYSAGSGINFSQAGEMAQRRMQTFNYNRYETASRSGQHIREQHPLLTIHRPVPEDKKIQHNDPEHVEQVLASATNEKNLPGGSLTAAGGWCAPSEVLYDLGDDTESSDGLLSLPEIGVARGGVSMTKGLDFSDIYDSVESNRISFTEDQDENEEYDGGSEGDKPHITIDCPEFEEYRLDVSGVWVQTGVLQSKGYPEVQDRVIRGVTVAHDHVMNGKILSQMEDESTSVSMSDGQVGATAPILSSIEMQAEHYRYKRRMSRGDTLELVLPYWVRGAIRSDLALREGVDMLDVGDDRIAGWFDTRGVAPQFVYNWQALTGDAGDFTSWPEQVKFMLYASGTWVRGTSDLITLDTLYDSSLLARNNFTALFTEEGWFVAQRGHDSRVVSLGMSKPGAAACCAEVGRDGTSSGGD